MSAKFHKVSLDQFKKDCPDYIDAEKALNNLSLPTRSTQKSAGYDFYLPYDISLNEFKPTTVATGIRCEMDQDQFLAIFPRSGLGFKYGVRLMNTVGIIDADYFMADNEGHIMAKLKADKAIDLKAGDRIMQGILLKYDTAQNGNTDNTRTGGFGSTGK